MLGVISDIFKGGPVRVLTKAAPQCPMRPSHREATIKGEVGNNCTLPRKAGDHSTVKHTTQRYWVISALFSTAKDQPFKTLVPLACQCDPEHADGCEQGSGRCHCKPNFRGDHCEECAVGYDNFPFCSSKYLLQNERPSTVLLLAPVH